MAQRKGVSAFCVISKRSYTTHGGLLSRYVFIYELHDKTGYAPGYQRVSDMLVLIMCFLRH